MKNRNYGIDILKIISCLMVVGLHVFTVKSWTFNLNDILKSYVYYLGTLAIPIFFMINGFFMLNKGKTVSYKYIKKKEWFFLRIVLLAIIILAIPFSLKNHQNYFETVYFIFLSSLQFKVNNSGILMHFWFFWSLILILLGVPLFYKLLHRKCKIYTLLLLVLFIFNICLDVANHFQRVPYDQYVPQFLRMNLWVFYYFIGGIIGYNFDSFSRIINSHKKKWVVCTIFFVLLVGLYGVTNRYLFGFKWAEWNYENVLTVVSSILLFGISTLSDKFNKKNVEKIVSLTLGVYIIHPFIFKLIKPFIPENGVFIYYLLAYLVTVIVSFLLVYIIRKNEWVKRLI
ncbi:acyltransferase [Limosilactobacillus ingluviei]|uniref:acyltransferase n=1 Tax=Limosilactobacillus ingluviei TaxID=148604 RepID=UPI00195B91D9|nr:acyltransferase [Limosilactobacillus ingluviei]MBM6729524.1 acyltransferase [Limosilactobacillus ingluviei]